MMGARTIAGVKISAPVWKSVVAVAALLLGWSGSGAALCSCCEDGIPERGEAHTTCHDSNPADHAAPGKAEQPEQSSQPCAYFQPLAATAATESPSTVSASGVSPLIADSSGPQNIHGSYQPGRPLGHDPPFPRADVPPGLFDILRL